MDYNSMLWDKMVVLVIDNTSIRSTTEMVQQKFDELFDNQVIRIVEEIHSDQKRFEITLENQVRHGYLNEFISELDNNLNTIIMCDEIVWTVSIKPEFKIG